MKKILLFVGFILSTTFIQAQSKPADTVVVRVGEASRITVTIQNKNDLETLKKYDFQSLMNDLIKKLEEKDTTNNIHTSEEYLKTEPKQDVEVIVSNEESNHEDWDWENDHHDKEKWHSHRTHQSFNFDIGTNNYLTGSGFPDQDNSLYTVKPWGSWYVGINSVQRTKLAQKFFLEWGLGVSWYNFKYQNEQTMMSKDDNSVLFELDSRNADFKKSKLTATYVNATLVPMFDFGDNRRKPSIFDGRNSDSFRIGVGPYIG
jgi:hypothetical protein